MGNSVQFLAKIFYKTTDQSSFIFGLAIPQGTDFLFYLKYFAVTYIFHFNL